MPHDVPKYRSFLVLEKKHISGYFIGNQEERQAKNYVVEVHHRLDEKNLERLLRGTNNIIERRRIVYSAPNPRNEDSRTQWLKSKI